MFQSCDLLAMSIISIGNKFLSTDINFEELENYSKLLNVSLNSDLEYLDKFEIIENNRCYEFSVWLKSIIDHSAKFVLISKFMFNNSFFNDKAFSNDIDERILHAFEGENVFIVGLVDSGNIRLFKINMYVPSKSLITAVDFIKFIENNKQKEKLIEVILWNSTYNLDLCDVNSWEEFKKVLNDKNLYKLLEIWDLCISNESIDVSLYSEWDKFCAKHSNSETRIVYKMCYIGNIGHLPEKRNFETERNNHIQILRKLEDFSLKMNAKMWAKHFACVRNIIENNTFELNGFAQIFKKCGLSDKAISLIEASLRSDVFGGMGSWNDVPFINASDYVSLSNKLFLQIFYSIIAALG
jgi:hypothetical protein